jgi:hypothetical protein
MALNTNQTSTFETVAREHLKNLEDAGESRDQIVGQLTAVASSYAADGLSDEAAALTEMVKQYQSEGIRADERSSCEPTIAPPAKEQD